MEAMRGRGIRKGLRRRVKEVLEETNCRIKVEEEIGSFGLKRE